MSCKLNECTPGQVKHIEWVDVTPEEPVEDILENAEPIPEEVEELQAA